MGRAEGDDVQAARAAARVPPTEEQVEMAKLLAEYEAAGWIVVAFPASIAAGVDEMPATQHAAMELSARLREFEARCELLGVTLDGER